MAGDPFADVFGDNNPGQYSDPKQYQAAYDEWVKAGQNGEPRGPMPTLNSHGRATQAMQQNGYPTSIANQGMWSGLTQAGAQAGPRDNPYSAIMANQARPAQEALYAQMQAMQAGPSLAAMQGQRAQGQNLQAALGAGGGRPMMARAGGIGAGLAADTGAARLAEQIRGSQAMGSLASGVRGADLGVAGAQSQAGLQQRGLDDAMKQFYAAQGAGFENTLGRNKLEEYRLHERLRKTGKERDLQAVNTALGVVGTSVGGVV